MPVFRRLELYHHMGDYFGSTVGRVEYIANSFHSGYNRLRHALTARRGISERSTPL